jgi:gliding motility-associated-like protein
LYTSNLDSIYNLGSGLYILNITDDNGCVSKDSLEIFEPLLLTPFIDGTNLDCHQDNSGTIDLTVTGGTPNTISPLYTFNWTGPAGYTSTIEDPQNLAAGTYSVTATDNNGCINTQSILVTEPVILSSSITGKNLDCYQDNSGTIDVTVSGGTVNYIFAWTGPAGYTSTIEDPQTLASGTYNVTVTDNNGCITSENITLTNPLELIIADINITNATCYAYSDGSVGIGISGGSKPYGYQLLDNLGAIIDTTEAAMGLSAGTYVYQVLDNNNCPLTSTITIEDPVEIEILQQPSCYGSISVEVLNASGVYQIFWQGNIDSVYIDGLAVGKYIVTVIDEIGCVKVDSFNVNQVFDYSITDASCSKVGDGIINIDNINSGIAPYSIYLNGDLLDDNVINTMEIANLLKGAYMLTLIDNSGCEFTDSLFVDYIGGYDCIIVPIIISPNNDGTNDFWHPIYDVDTEIKVTILNRWGQVEYYYQGNSVVFQWDGLGGRGNKLPSADYYYIIKYQNNSYPDRTGVVTLIR